MRSAVGNIINKTALAATDQARIQAPKLEVISRRHVGGTWNPTTPGPAGGSPSV